MTTTDWIIDIALVLIVVRQMREEKLTLRFVLVPLGIVAFTAHKYLHSLPTAGNDLTLLVSCVAAGLTLGVIGGLVTKVRAAGGAAYVRAGKAAAALWIGSMGARLAFIIYITHSAGSVWLERFSVTHDITSAAAWQTALVLLALSEVVARIALIVIRGRLAAARSLHSDAPAGELVTA